MPTNRVAIAFTAIAAAFVLVLAGIMVWVYASEPRTGQFTSNFSLIDNHGNKVDQRVFQGKPSLVYFGYTHCPEACPTTLYEMAGWFEKLGVEGKDLKGYFFTIDPERDNQQVMDGYVSAFTDRITGFTGDLSEIRKVTDGWRVYAEKVPNANGGYSMDHTLSLFLIGADGRLKGIIPYGADHDQSLEKIKATLLNKA